MVVADAGDFGDVLGHSQFIIENHTNVMHSTNRRDGVSSKIKSYANTL